MRPSSKANGPVPASEALAVGSGPAPDQSTRALGPSRVASSARLTFPIAVRGSPATTTSSAGVANPASCSFARCAETREDRRWFEVLRRRATRRRRRRASRPISGPGARRRPPPAPLGGAGAPTHLGGPDVLAARDHGVVEPAVDREPPAAVELGRRRRSANQPSAVLGSVPSR